MKRICRSLSAHQYDVLLVGRRTGSSPPLRKEPYSQKRLPCFFKKGKLFYAEYNLRLFFFLLFRKFDAVCAIDLDTIIPCYLVSGMRNKKRIYDAHEYFSQLHEVVSRPGVYRIWHWIERKMVPRFRYGYTVCQSIADELKKYYGVGYSIIRNIPPAGPPAETGGDKSIILYQGAVNYGRGLDELVKAMLQLDGVLWICGSGNYIRELKNTVSVNNLQEKVVFYGMLDPSELRSKTLMAGIAVNPFENKGLNQYLSLSNKFFDYIHAAIPQVTMNYPEYRHINDEYEVAVLIDRPFADDMARSIRLLRENESLYNRLRESCHRAIRHLNWQTEEKKLIEFYKNIFHG